VDLQLHREDAVREPLDARDARLPRADPRRRRRIVARPFAKFFNYGTPQAVIPAEPFVVTEKIDGSLGILYYLDGEPHIATRGSFTSEQAARARRCCASYEIEWTPGTTPLFEIVYPENRIVVDYGDRRELVLLAAIDHATGRDAPLPLLSGRWSAPTIDADDLDSPGAPTRARTPRASSSRSSRATGSRSSSPSTSACTRS
jgi:hypothetical protein